MIFHRHLHKSYPFAVKGEECYVLDRDGKRYLDGSSGAAVSCLGHSDAKVIEAMVDQLQAIPFAHTNFFTTQAMESAAQALLERAPPGLTRVLFVSGGSEAVESGLKLARQYFVELGQPQRIHVLARRQSYHGTTLGALSVSDHKARRSHFLPLFLPETSRIIPCYPYREQFPEESEDEFARRCADDLERTLLEIGPETVIAFIAETVVGATLGAVPPSKRYFRYIRDICDRYGILLFLDEVMCGVGYTGTFFACEQEDVAPDLLTLAKGLAAGYHPLGALLISDAIDNVIRNGSGFFQHGYTFSGHAVGCAAAKAVISRFQEEDLLARVQSSSRYLQDLLFDRFQNHPHIGDIRGRGLFWGLEFVQDRERKEPFPPSLKFHQILTKEALNQGLLCYPMGGTVDGHRGDHVLISPPLICRPAHLEELVDKLHQAIDRSLLNHVS